jgi:hypothetical protein
MTMLPLNGMLTSAAGTALSQTAGSETERSQKDSLARERVADVELHAEQSAGIGQTDKDEESSERDADGRRLWEKTPGSGKKGEAAESSVAGQVAAQERQSKDPTGQSGTHLDLTG